MSDKWNSICLTFILPLMDVPYRQFTRNIWKLVRQNVEIAVSDKTGLLGFWVPADIRNKELTVAKKPTEVTLSDKIDAVTVSDKSEPLSDNIVSDMSDVFNGPDEEPCELCKKEVETKKTWEDGEEKTVCYPCIVSRYGKIAMSIWRKMT